VGKVTLKSNGDEALNDVFSIKSNSDEAFNAKKKLQGELYSAQPCVISSDVKSCAHGRSEPFKRMVLNGAHQEDSTVATSVSKCRTMCISICNLISY
jgi:hypothetical protein